MTCRRYKNQNLYVSDRAHEPGQKSADYDKLYKICPVFNMEKDIFAESYKPGKNKTIDEGIISSKADLVMYNYYLLYQ